MNCGQFALKIVKKMARAELKGAKDMNRMSLWAIIGLFVATSIGYGNLGGPVSLSNLEHDADLIVMGTASGTFQFGTAAGFSLQVGRVLKGDGSLVGSVLVVSVANLAANAREAEATMTAAGSGLWFLQRSSNGWLLLPVQQGYVPLRMTFFPASIGPILSAYAYSSTAALSEKIASEICSAIEGTNGSLPLQFVQLHYGLLDQLNSPVVALYYQRMSASTSAQQQILGLSGLIRGGSGAALTAAARSASAFGTYPQENSVLLIGIRDYFRATDSTSIAALGQVAVDSTYPTAFREADAHALAAIHTITTLPYLATLLDDADSNLQIEAIGGLGAFANGLPVQTAAGVASLAYLQLPPNAPFRTADTMANFAKGARAIQQNQASYTSFWKQWWSQQRGVLGF